MLALFSFAFGLILRHTAGAITAVLGLLMVVAAAGHIHAWMPNKAGYLILSSTRIRPRC